MTTEADGNRAWWDERAALHGGDGFFYDVDAFLDGAPGISERESGELEAAIGSIASADILHLQCHIGLTTLALARSGARVVALDFSAVAIDRPRAIASEAGLDAEFVVADSQELPLELVDRFDCVFASYGVLMWIADLRSWMRSAGAALRDGGKLVVVEGHPVSTVVRSTHPIRLAGGVSGWRGGRGRRRRLRQPRCRARAHSIRQLPMGRRRRGHDGHRGGFRDRGADRVDG